MTRWSVALAASVVVLTACSSTSTNRLEDAGTASGGCGNSGGASGSAGVSGCSQGMESVEASSAAAYCMDKTEVTNDAYAAFLAACPSISAQPEYCAWNTSYEPMNAWPAPTDKADHPVVWVDFCDAYAYCKWAGKRLCGQIGGEANAFAEHENVALSQWFNACSDGGLYGFPYGATYLPAACNGGDSANGATIKAGVALGCISSDGLYDLSGNVWEWEDSCNGAAGSLDDCRVRGGSFKSGVPEGTVSQTLGCGYGGSFKREARGDDIGFRCCGL